MVSWRRRRTARGAAQAAARVDDAGGGSGTVDVADGIDPADTVDPVDTADPADPVDTADPAEGAGDASPGAASEQELAEAEDARLAALEVRRSQVGPFDASEVSPEHGGVDLGALRLVPPPGAELRLEVEPDGQRVVAATVVAHGSSVQVHVFAAPRTTGVWDEVRSEIAASVGAQGGAAQEVEAPGGFGRELLARMPATTPDGQEGFTLTRFSGVDGPRWFLRAVFSGPAVLDRSAAAALEACVRSAVVVRGEEAMAPRDLLALSLPEGAVPAAPGAPAPGADGAPADAQEGRR